MAPGAFLHRGNQRFPNRYPNSWMVYFMDVYPLVMTNIAMV